MIRRLLLAAALVAWAVPASAQNCVTINGVTRCAAPWQLYDTTVRSLSLPVIDLSQTWNAPGVTFTGWKLNITDTNSATASLLLDLQVGGTSKFSVTKAGLVTTGTGGVTFGNGTVLKDTALGTVAMVSSAATNQIQVPNGSNLEYGSLSWVSNFLNVGTVTNSGTARVTRLISASSSVLLATSSGDSYVLTTTGPTTFGGQTVVGKGVPFIVANARSTAQAAAVASVATFTVGAADGTFEISANVLVVTATTHTFNVECAYTDEGNTARTVILPFRLVGDTTAVTSSVVNTNGAVPYNGITLQIRAKAATSITIRTQAAGTYTTVSYNVEGTIKWIS